MIDKIESTLIFEKSIYTKVVVGHQKISISTIMNGIYPNVIVSVARFTNLDIQNRTILEIPASNVTHALINHIALTKAVLENDLQKLTPQHLIKYWSPLNNVLNQSNIRASESSFDTEFTRRFLSENIGYSPEEISHTKKQYAKYLIAALIIIFIFNYSFSYFFV